MTLVDTPASAKRKPKPYPIIDADVHIAFNSWAELQPYMDEPWRSIVVDPGSRPGGNGYRAYGGHHRRSDAIPADGGEPGSDIPLLRKQLLDETGVDVAIVTCDMYAMNILPNADYANAIIAASNDWMLERWLIPNRELRGMLSVNSQDPPAAVKEIERLGGRPEFATIIMSGTSTAPYGNKFYHPIYEAAERFRLPISLHLANAGVGIAHAISAVGYPTTYFEYHTGLPRIYQAHIVSLICEGVFEKFPGLKWVFIEGGVAWLPHVMWRFDKNWKALRGETPWVRRRPSDYIREHCRFTTQPIEEPDEPEHLLQIFKMVDAGQTLMYSSDYPHWDFDPTTVLAHLPADLQRRILYETARETLRLE
jgi:predicted TIM-barrel fold metal-dependent hydrolase